MSYETMKLCADMTLANAIEDMVLIEGIPLEEARNKAIESIAHECLYDFETGMWKEGPDYFRDMLARFG